MIRLLLVAFGGWMAWRYRSRIREFASRLPEIETRTGKGLDEGTDRIKEGPQDITGGLHDLRRRDC